MLEARGLAFRFAGAGELFRDVSFRLWRGETLALTGPSGCGKTTLGRILAGWLTPCAGEVSLDGLPITAAGYRPVQYLSQAPAQMMNPRWRIGRILREAFEPDEGLRLALGIDPIWEERFPHELSEGQLQRVSLVRALGPGTRCLVADEITAPLDAVSQARLWTVLKELAARRGIAILAIGHDTALLSRIADRTMTMGAIHRDAMRLRSDI